MSFSSRIIGSGSVLPVVSKKNKDFWQKNAYTIDQLDMYSKAVKMRSSNYNKAKALLKYPHIINQYAQIKFDKFMQFILMIKADFGLDVLNSLVFSCSTD